MIIKMYMTPHCEWSKKAALWLKKKKLQFEELDITESQNKLYRDEILAKTGQIITPTFDIDGKIVIGFNIEELEKNIGHS